MSLFILILKYLCSVHSFCCCPSPLILGHYSSVIIVHCFPPCLAKTMGFFLPHLFSSIVLVGFSLISVALLWVVSKIFTQQVIGQAVVTSAHLTSCEHHLVFLGKLSNHSPCFSLGLQTWLMISCRKKVKPASSQWSMSWCCTSLLKGHEKTWPHPGTGTAACCRLCMLVPRFCVTTRGAQVLKDCSSSLLCQAACSPLSQLDSQGPRLDESTRFYPDHQ